MPCYDGGPSSSKENILQNNVTLLQYEKAKLEAMLCGIIRAIEAYNTDEYLDGIYTIIENYFDEKESGIKKQELIAWWEKHNKNDIKRKALEKLTEEEKEALGLV